MTTLLRRAQDLLPFDPLDEQPMLPSVWTGEHVGLRLVEAMQTLRLLPGEGLGSRSAWPPYLYEFDDLVEQQRQGELERTQQIQNRTRVSPSLTEISRMELVIWWPMHFLMFGAPHLVESVMWLSHAYSIERDAEWVVRKRGGFADTWRARHARGCEIIAEGLMAEKVRVF
ncbi:hypothetical protein [Bradyrhizobium elkanii]|uniref:hypothetical protein n=1 Tax=Bradyrhizobium elkanii TaxID=29448 RepID=UPI0003F70ACC|nr:hypothetical protein [Bradyrhizobium elkanii]